MQHAWSRNNQCRALHKTLFLHLTQLSAFPMPCSPHPSHCSFPPFCSSHPMIPSTANPPLPPPYPNTPPSALTNGQLHRQRLLLPSKPAQDTTDAHRQQPRPRTPCLVDQRTCRRTCHHSIRTLSAYFPHNLAHTSITQTPRRECPSNIQTSHSYMMLKHIHLTNTHPPLIPALQKPPPSPWDPPENIPQISSRFPPPDGPGDIHTETSRGRFC